MRWTRDGISYNEERALAHIDAMRRQDLALAQILIGFPWIRDDIRSNEVSGLEAINTIARLDPSLAKTIVGFPWVRDKMEVREREAVQALKLLAITDLSLAREIASFPWLAYEPSHKIAQAAREVRVIKAHVQLLRELAQSELSMARMVSRLPWVVDGLTLAESNAVGTLGDMFKEDPRLARSIISILPKPLEPFHISLVRELRMNISDVRDLPSGSA